MSKRSSFLIFLVFLCAAVVWLMRPFLSAIVLSLTLVIGLWPLYTVLVRVFFGKRWIASFVTTIVLAVIILIPTLFLVDLAVDQALALVHYIPEKKELWLPVIKTWAAKLNINLSWDTFGDVFLPEIIQKGTQLLSQFSPRILINTTQFVLFFIIMLLITFFLFTEGPAFYRELLALSPLEESYGEHLASEINNTLKACLYGYILTAIAQATLAGVGFALIGIPIAAILGIATLFASFIPIIGATGVWMPTAIYFALTGNWKSAIFVAVYGAIIISGIDNILKPLIIQGRTNIHPLLIFLTILGGLQAFGPIGFLVGPLLMALLLVAVRIYKRDFLQRV